VRVVVVVLLSILNFYHLSYGQSVLPNPLEKNFFRSPVDFDYRLSGNFCELRETHFHAGIDIKPSGKGKDFIYSIADGYISRIKVSADGYGLVLYVDHPEVGYTSVYAHLDSFNDHIAYVVRQYQMNLESWEIDILPDPDILPVKKGEIIGVMGNTGYSFGNHLHFEIRDTKSEDPINPAHFGIAAQDKIPPSLLTLAIHGLNNDIHKIWERKISLTNYSAQQIEFSDAIEVPALQAGVSIQMYDRTDGSHNKQGIYGFHLYVDDVLSYSYHMDRVSFDQNRQVTGFYDFKLRKTTKSTYYLCYKFPGSDMDFLKNSANGIILLNPETEKRIRIEIEDFDKNKRTLIFRLKGSAQYTVDVAPSPESTYVSVGDSVVMYLKNISIEFGAKSLYRNIDFTLDTISRNGKESQYRIHHKYEPIKQPISIKIKPELSDKDLSKAVIVKENGGKISYGGRWKDGYLTTKIDEFGVYGIEYDSTAPTIKKVLFSTKASKIRRFRFSVRDNLAIKSRYADDVKIKVWIDGVFMISPYSAKTDILEIPLSGIGSGKHQLKIEVTDHCGNIGTFSSDFWK
jgi:hypothetical protein